MRRTVRLVGASLFFAAVSLAFVLPASAGTLSIRPLTIDLGPTANSTSLTVQNDERLPVNIVITGYKWSQTATASQILASTTDLIVYPRSMTLAAGEHRAIRVGILHRSGTTEDDYRLLISELPAEGAAPAAQGDMLRLVARVSLPIFVGRVKGQAHLTALNASVNETALSFAMSNTGTSHAIVRDTTVSVADASGKELLSKHVTGWYVLPAQSQRYTIQTPKQMCNSVARVHIHATVVNAPAYDSWLIPTRLCGSGSSH